MSRLITFLSDFGTSDEWAGVCKAVMLERAPSARIADISHDIPPYDVGKGAFLLCAAASHLDPAIHLAVVDPGVGTERRILCVETLRGDILVGPDNGILIPAAERLMGIREAYAVENEDLFRNPVSPTFHARDIMSPVVATLAEGNPPSIVGPTIPLDSLRPAPWTMGSCRRGHASAEMIEVDTFGSCHLAIDINDAAAQGFELPPPGQKVMIEGPKRQEKAISATTFGDAHKGGLLVMWDATDFLTIAVNQERADQRMQLDVGDKVKVSFPSDQ